MRRRLALDAAEHDRNRLVDLADSLRVDDDASIGTFAAETARRVGIVAAHAAIRGVAIHHRIHVSAGDAEKQARRAECRKVVSAAPIRLRDDADFEPLCLEHPADDGHAETGVIDVGIPGDDDDVALIPPQRRHFRARGRQKTRRRHAGECCFIR